MFQAEGIDPRTREMIILRAAKVLNAPYETQANVQMAKNGCRQGGGNENLATRLNAARR
jgi:alkylhydroperoxidase/carboxymuconolactone decarboxylase family protein YurZ